MTTSRYTSTGSLTINDEDAKIVMEALQSGNTFSLLNTQVGRGNHSVVTKYYRKGDIYYFKLTNDIRREFIKRYKSYIKK
jgi:hypothetical protein